MSARLLPFFLLCCALPVASQTVINTERMRPALEGRDIAGAVDLSFALSRNKAGQYLNPELDLSFVVNNPSSHWLALLGYELNRFTNLNAPGAIPTNFTNEGFLHLRYGHDLNAYLTLEGFGQAQYNEIQEIDLRTLAGLSLRYAALETDTSNVYLGITYMYEYEKSSADPENIVIDRAHRASAYLSGSYRFNELLRLSHVTYLQPRFTDLQDYRISTETSLGINISDSFQLTMGFQLNFDSQPPETVPQTMFSINNGVAVAF